MRYRVILSPDAEAGIDSAIRWYAQQQLELSFRFKAETEMTLHRVVQNPYQFPRVSNVVRRALMNRFPYAIYFKTNADEVVVLTVSHHRRLSPWNTP